MAEQRRGGPKLTAKAERAEAGVLAGPIVVLARPQLGENVGLVARAMLNFGLADLRLVRPRFGWPNAKAVAAAAGAYAVLNRVRTFPSLDEAIADLQLLFATTARAREMDKPVVDAEQAAELAQQALARGERVGYLFGPERTGLTNEEIALADRILTVPLNPHFSSLNVAQAVLICAYAWFRRRAPDQATPRALREPEPVSKGELRRFLDYLTAALEERGFFRSATSRPSLERRIALLFEKRALSAAELNLLFGIVRKLHEPRR